MGRRLELLLLIIPAKMAYEIMVVKFHDGFELGVPIFLFVLPMLGLNHLESSFLVLLCGAQLYGRIHLDILFSLLVFLSISVTDVKDLLNVLRNLILLVIF